jgi:hypothetical protein
MSSETQNRFKENEDGIRNESFSPHGSTADNPLETALHQTLLDERIDYRKCALTSFGMCVGAAFIGMIIAAFSR